MHHKKVDKINLSDDFGLTGERELSLLLLKHIREKALYNNITFKSIAKIIDIPYETLISGFKELKYKKRAFIYRTSIKYLAKLGFDIELKITHPKTTSSKVNVESTDLKNLE